MRRGVAPAVAVGCVLVAAAAATGPFAWFRPAAAPTAWPKAALAGGRAVLSYPAAFARAPGDPGTVTAQIRDRAGTITGYLNATPRQGNETLADWPDFRIDHQREEETAVHEEGRAFGLAFRGGTGSCVLDRYVTRTKSHSYREIACYVAGPHGGSVLVAAAPPALWGTVGKELEQAVSAYDVG